MILWTLENMKNDYKKKNWFPPECSWYLESIHLVCAAGQRTWSWYLGEEVAAGQTLGGTMEHGVTSPVPSWSWSWGFHERRSSENCRTWIMNIWKMLVIVNTCARCNTKCLFKKLFFQKWNSFIIVSAWWHFGFSVRFIS